MEGRELCFHWITHLLWTPNCFPGPNPPFTAIRKVLFTVLVYKFSILHNKLPQRYQLKTTHIYYPMIPVGQECEHYLPWLSADSVACSLSVLRLCSHLEAWWGKNLLLGAYSLLLVITWSIPPAPRGYLKLLDMWLPP